MCVCVCVCVCGCASAPASCWPSPRQQVASVCAFTRRRAPATKRPPEIVTSYFTSAQRRDLAAVRYSEGVAATNFRPAAQSRNDSRHRARPSAHGSALTSSLTSRADANELAPLQSNVWASLSRRCETWAFPYSVETLPDRRRAAYLTPVSGRRPVELVGAAATTSTVYSRQPLSSRLVVIYRNNNEPLRGGGYNRRKTDCLSRQ